MGVISSLFCPLLPLLFLGVSSRYCVASGKGDPAIFAHDDFSDSVTSKRGHRFTIFLAFITKRHGPKLWYYLELGSLWAQNLHRANIMAFIKASCRQNHSRSAGHKKYYTSEHPVATHLKSNREWKRNSFPKSALSTFSWILGGRSVLNADQLVCIQNCEGMTCYCPALLI